MPTASWGWREVKLFVRFFIYSISALGAFVTLWITLDLPQVASKDYVNQKFQVASDSNKTVQNQINYVRIQMNRMSRQALEAEKYRLTEQAKTDNSFDLQQRLRDIDSDLEDIARERATLLQISR